MIIDRIYEKFPNMRDMRARQIRIDKNQRKISCLFSYPNVKSLSANSRGEITNYVYTLIPQGYRCFVEYIDDSFTEISFRKLLEDLLSKNYPLFALSKNQIAIEFSNNSIYVNFRVNKVLEENMEVAGFIKRLSDFFESFTSYKVDFSITLDENASVLSSVAEQERLVQLAINKELFKPARFFKVNDVNKYIGKVVVGTPMYISDIRNAMDSCILCGRISNKSIKVSKNNPNMQVCKFTLTDDSQTSIACVMFVKFQITDLETIKATVNKSDAEIKTMSNKAKLANEKLMDKLVKLYDGTDVVVRGKISFNDYSERLEVIVYDLSKCQIAPLIEQKTSEQVPPATYLIQAPHKYNEFVQISFVEAGNFHSVIADKKYVLLHVNATGFNVTKDKILAICAVKIVNGRIASKWFTYVNPDMAVSANLLKEAKTENERLLFYPTLSEIISDLYKYTYGCELIGLNLAHIVELLNYYAAPTGYRFVNSLIDQSDLLSRLFDTSLYDKKPNCSKYVELSKVCKVKCPSYTFCGETAVTIAECICKVASNQQSS